MQIYEIEGYCCGLFNEKHSTGEKDWKKQDIGVYVPEINEYGEKREAYVYVTFWNTRVDMYLTHVQKRDKVKVRFFMNGSAPRDWNGTTIAKNELRGIDVTNLTGPEKMKEDHQKAQVSTGLQPGQTVYQGAQPGKQKMDAAVQMLADTLGVEKVSKPAEPAPKQEDDNDLPF